MTSKPMLTLMCMPSQLSTKTEFLTVIMRVWWRNMLEGRGGGRRGERGREEEERNDKRYDEHEGQWWIPLLDRGEEER